MRNILLYKETNIELFDHNEYFMFGKKIGRLASQRIPCQLLSMEVITSHFGDIFLQEGHHKINDILKKENYEDIMKEHIKISARKIELSYKVVFEMEIRPRNLPDVAKSFKDNVVKVLERPSRNTDLIPIENILKELRVPIK